MPFGKDAELDFKQAGTKVKTFLLTEFDAIIAIGNLSMTFKR